MTHAITSSNTAPITAMIAPIVDAAIVLATTTDAVIIFDDDDV
jgi:hypothetical protein